MVSRAEVESSKMTILAFLAMVRAIEIRCFWPPEKLRPRCSTTALS